MTSFVLFWMVYLSPIFSRRYPFFPGTLNWKWSISSWILKYAWPIIKKLCRHTLSEIFLIIHCFDHNSKPKAKIKNLLSDNFLSFIEKMIDYCFINIKHSTLDKIWCKLNINGHSCFGFFQIFSSPYIMLFRLIF